MKRIFFGVLGLALAGQSAYGQEFKKVVDIVVETESSLKSMIAKEESQRKSETATLTNEVEEIRRLLAQRTPIRKAERPESSITVTNDGLSQRETPGTKANEPVVPSQESPGVQKDEQVAQAEGSNLASDFWRSPALTGDWNNGRTWMSDHGIELAGLLKGDGFFDVHGGLDRNSAYLQNIDVTLDIDVDKLLGWNGGRLFVHVMSNNGGDLSRYVGDAQIVSNIEAPRIAKLYQAWVQQDLWHGGLSILVGLYDLNSEFYATETSGLFLNSSHGIGKEFSQTGMNGPSIFPNTSTAARIAVRPGEAFYIETVVLDGVPGTPGDPTRTSFHFSKREGLLLVGEAGYCLPPEVGEDYGVAKLAIGAWRYTSQFDKLNEVGENGEAAKCSDNWGIYLLAEKTLYNEPGKPGQGLGAFLRLGRANGCVNEFDYHLGIGAVYTGLFPGRERDQLGVAFAHAHNGAEYMRAAASAGRYMKSMEDTAELTYKAQLTPWLAFQPDVQYVIHPSTDPQLSNALVVGSRFLIIL